MDKEKFEKRKLKKVADYTHVITYFVTEYINDME